MSQEKPGGAGQSAAEHAFAEWLARIERDGEDAADFEGYCAQHSELAGELRQLHDDWHRLAGVFDVLGVRGTLTARLENQFGKGVDPCLSLEREPESDTDEEFMRSMLSRLSGRGGGYRRYHVKGEVARGGMGRILRVWDEDLRRNLAMKVLLTDGSTAEDADTRRVTFFLEEAQVTAQLDHPGIVPVHEVGVDSEGATYFTMKLVKGRELETIIDMVHAGEEGWTLPRSLGVIQRVCETLAYAHDKGVVHRDLKPANVMVGRFGEAYVMDWGLARVLGRGERSAALSASPGPSGAAESLLDPERPAHDSTGSIVGTPSFMSPEQARGEIVDERTDVYAAGALLYQLLSQERPYVRPGEDPTALEVIARVQAGPPEPLRNLRRDVSEELEAICERAMARNPDERYPSALAMAEELRAYLEGRVVQAHRTGALIEFKKWVLRNKGVAAALLGVVLVALIGAGTTSYVDKQGRKTAEAERDRVQRLDDMRVLRDLAFEETEASFWPPTADRLPHLTEWLVKLQGVHGRLASHEEYLARFDDGPEAMEGQLLFAGATPSEDVLERDRTRYASFVQDVSALPERLEWISARARSASIIEETTVTGEVARQRWQQAIEAIAKLEVYEGVELRPQLGLLPLRQDPESELWEFHHVLSGEAPQVTADGRYELTPETGIVLVLLPGGDVTVGSLPEAEGGPFEDRWHMGDESLLHVRLDPFFIAKYEVAQAQWQRIMGSSPGDRIQITEGPLFPMAMVTWHESMEFTRRLVLELPTEAQWEYSCRADTTAPFSFDTSTFSKAVNCADLRYANSKYKPSDPHQEWDDGHAFAAPVGSYSPNGFGLHDVHGNVWEWCRDRYLGVRTELQSGSGLIPEGVSPTIEAGCIRGGSWTGQATNSRSANRYNWGRHAVEPDLGLRPVRWVDS